MEHENGPHQHKNRDNTNESKIAVNVTDQRQQLHVQNAKQIYT